MAAALAAALLCAAPGATPRAAEQEPGRDAPLPAVVVAQVAAEPIRAPIEFVGRVEAIRVLDVRARVRGFIAEVAFDEGAAVRAGDPLFLLDPAQYEAELAAAEARLSRAQATVEEAERSLGRARELLRTNAAPQARVDESTAQFRGGQADVLAAEAEIRLARLNLSYARIEASIDGRIGRAFYQLGALVGPDSGALARVVQLDPIRVVFSLTEGELVDIRQAQARGDGGSADRSVFRLRLPNGSNYEAEGRLDFVDSEVAPNTGTVAVRVAFDNPDRVLLPGQFVNVVVAERRPERRPVVPFSALHRDREGTFVYVLGEDGATAERRRIETGARLPRGWAVLAGLEAGETVVVQGGQRLRDRERVRAVPQDEPARPPPAPGGRR